MIEEFDDNDWNHMGSCVFFVKNEKLNRLQLIEIFKNLPEELQHEAFAFGMSDTVWRDNFIEYLS